MIDHSLDPAALTVIVLNIIKFRVLAHGLSSRVRAHELSACIFEFDVRKLGYAFEFLVVEDIFVGMLSGYAALYPAVMLVS